MAISFNPFSWPTFPPSTTGATNVSGQNTQTSSSNPSQTQLGASQSAQAALSPYNQANIWSSSTSSLGVSSYQSLGYQPLTLSPGGYISSSGYIAPSGTSLTKEPPKPLATSEWRLGELVGYRAWDLSGGFLRSVSSGSLWAPGEPMDGKTKSTAEHCGVYSYKKLRKVLDDWGQGISIIPRVYGSVWLWGDIIEHEDGYRAEYAMVRSLDGWIGGPESSSNALALEALRRKYNLEA